MKRLFAFFSVSLFFFSSFSVLAAGDPPVNKLTKKEKKQGWTLLYDGKTTAGWHVYQQKSDGSAWKSVDGALMLDPSKREKGRIVGGGDLVTDAVFQDFHFSVEWKISPKGNSGIIFLLQEDKKYEHPWHTGPEMQVLDNEGHPDGKITSHRSGDLYDLIRSSSEPVKGPGEWNKAEIRFKKGKLDLYMNGVLVVSTMMGDENWKQLVAKSKFRRWPDFATFTSGRIALQDHGDPVWYRNIKIRKL
jgi:hypothetical protein